MKKVIININFVLTFLVILTNLSKSQSILDYGIILKTDIDYSNKKITLYWEPDTNTYNFFVYKKKVSDTVFGDYIAKLPANTTFFEDTLKEELIEYKIEKDAGKYYSYGYLLTGYNIELDLYNGRCLILIDSIVYPQIKNELNQFIEDLVSDGYKVIYLQVPRAEKFDKNKVQQVKNLIKQINSLYDDLTTLILIGRVPVPYSGDFAIDGHEDHYGAWPTDAYYAELDGIWTDTLTNRFLNIDSRFKNVPNDGKFDQLLFPSDIDLKLGRIDLYDLPYFQKSEIDLIKNYLNKIHLYKSGKLILPLRAGVIDNFGIDYKEAFAISGWTNFTSLLPYDSVYWLPNRFILNSEEYLWYYGCGPGTYTASHEALYSEELANLPFKTAFVMAFGSYNGDWDSQNNLLRSVLAAEPLGLTAVWSGRPHWFFHHMAYGFNIGFSTKLTQNVRASEYTTISPFARRMNHIALMGDPTLRMIYPKKIDKLITEITNDFIKIYWDYPIDSSITFNIYKFSYEKQEYIKINNFPFSSNFYIDSFPNLGYNKYMVKVRQKTYTNGGFYYNLSLGTMSEEVIYPFNSENIIISPNPTDNILSIFLKTADYSINNIKIFDMTGILVKNFNTIYNEKNLPINIELKDEENNLLSVGLYYIQIHFTNNKKQVLKFIVNR